MGLKIEDLSPLAAIMSGKGAIGELSRKGMLGLAPYAISSNSYNDAEEERQKAEAAQKPKGMKHGSAVKKKAGGYVKSADGCAKKGKTKGRFV